MWTYLIRRLLLMIPTLFGVTVVSFLIMKLAPGDPQLSQLSGGGTAGQSSQTRESWLLQRRDLKLDKPVIFNFQYFRDHAADVHEIAYFRSLDEPGISAELNRLAKPPLEPDAKARLAFLRKLDIPDLMGKLEDDEQRAGLAKSLDIYVQNYTSDLGVHGVPIAIDMLRSEKTPTNLKIGAIRALGLMAPDPFNYTYSRRPSAAETSGVVATWKLWWSEHGQGFQPVPTERQQALAEELHRYAAEPSRQKVFEWLETLSREDTPFFAATLLGESNLQEKVISALFLRLYNESLPTDVALDANREQVDRVAGNWIAHYDVHRAEYHFSTPDKLGSIVGDTQYAHMVWRLVTFNFGRSALKTRDPVGEKILQAVWVSAPLMLMSEVLIYLVAVPLGMICAVRHGTLTDRLITVGLFLLYSIPPFIAGMMFLLFFCFGDYLRLFPMERLHSEGAEQLGFVAYVLDYLWHATLPVVCLTLFSLASLAMYGRTAILDVINQDYVRTARSKGLDERKVIYKHVLRNGMIPLITLFASFLPALLGGSVLIEALFNIPGMGRLGWSSINQKDFPTLMALIYIDALVALASILVSDLLYVAVDPRISFEAQGQAK